MYNMYNDPVNHLLLIYIKSIVQEVQMVNKRIESNDIDIMKLYNDLVDLKEFVSQHVLNSTAKIDVRTQYITSYVDPSLYIGHAFETKLREYDQEEVTQNVKNKIFSFQCSKL